MRIALNAIEEMERIDEVMGLDDRDMALLFLRTADDSSTISARKKRQTNERTEDDFTKPPDYGNGEDRDYSSTDFGYDQYPRYSSAVIYCPLNQRITSFYVYHQLNGNCLTSPKLNICGVVFSRYGKKRFSWFYLLATSHVSILVFLWMN